MARFDPSIIMQRASESATGAGTLDCAQLLNLILHQMRLQRLEKIVRFGKPKADIARIW